MSLQNDTKKGILAVSFGTSYTDVIKNTIEKCENAIAESFPQYEVRRVFTSNMIRKKLKEKENIYINNLEEALDKMKEEGFDEIIVQPLHIIPGEEYHEKILKPAGKYKNSFKELIIGRPVLTLYEDYEIFIEALKNQLPELTENKAVLFMGHGTSHPANACYSMLQLMLMETTPNVFIGNVEGYPELENVIPRLKKEGIEELILMPLMLVAGDHAQNDMAGEDEDSWENVLKKENFKVETYMHGLGENKKFQELYINLIKDIL